MSDHPALDRSIITAGIFSRLATIRVELGARTDIGRAVFVGPRNVADHEAPCVLLLPGDESPDNTGGVVSTSIAFSLVGYTSKTRANVDDAVEAAFSLYPASAATPTFPELVGLEESLIIDSMLADVRKALEACDDVAWRASFRALIYDGARAEFSEDAGDLCSVSVQYRVLSPWRDAFV